MPELEIEQYGSEEGFRRAFEDLHKLFAPILSNFVRQECGTRDLIIRNFIARVDSLTRSIMTLWNIGSYSDCWILHRCLLDRLFLLTHLCESDEFEDFDDWQFVQEYEAQNRLRSDQAFNSRTTVRESIPTDVNKARYSDLSKNPPIWQRPKAEAIAKQKGYDFLYKYCYQYASKYVHPVPVDGQEDFFAIIGQESESCISDLTSFLPNTVLAGCLLVNEGLNGSSFVWHPTVYNSIDQVLDYIRPDKSLHHDALSKMIQLGQEYALCKPIDK